MTTAGRPTKVARSEAPRVVGVRSILKTECSRLWRTLAVKLSTPHVYIQLCATLLLESHLLLEVGGEEGLI